MDSKEIKKAFKPLKKLLFELQYNYALIWGVEKDGSPSSKIFVGRHGAPRPDFTFSPYDIERLEYTKPGLFKSGVLSIIGTDGAVRVMLDFKKKSNMKTADTFNEMLALCKSLELGK